MITDKTSKPKSFRLKVLTPTYTTLSIEINEDFPEYLRKSRRITGSNDVYQMFKHLVNNPREEFWVLHLSSKNRLICADKVSQGSLNAALVHPSSVFSSAILSAAAGLIFIHQHPSGDPEPSREDIELTNRLKDGAKLLGLRALDSIIIGQDTYFSFADRGLLS
jgi:DNA repair protein RadC